MYGTTKFHCKYGIVPHSMALSSTESFLTMYILYSYTETICMRKP